MNYQEERNARIIHAHQLVQYPAILLHTFTCNTRKMQLGDIEFNVNANSSISWMSDWLYAFPLHEAGLFDFTVHPAQYGHIEYIYKGA